MALNDDGNLMLIDTGGSWPPTLVTYSQDGRLIHHAPFMPLMGCQNAAYSKCRFMECVGDSVFVVDLGMFYTVFINHTAFLSV